jgi:hypothetical protein
MTNTSPECGKVPGSIFERSLGHSSAGLNGTEVRGNETEVLVLGNPQAQIAPEETVDQ